MCMGGGDVQIGNWFQIGIDYWYVIEYYKLFYIDRIIKKYW